MKIDDFTGLYWNGKHTSELKVKVVSNGTRYDLNPISSITNNTVDIPGGDGQYFYNATYGPKKWSINIAFDNLDDNDWRELQNWLNHKDLSDLVFDELPYKTYAAKLEGTPSITYLCFDEPDKKKPKVNGKYQKHRIYKGEGTLNFIAPCPYAYSALDKNGKYMKYLNEIEYFPNENGKREIEISIGVADSLANSKRSIIRLKQIKGTTAINQEEKTINRGAIGVGTFLTIYNDKKSWKQFSLVPNDETNELFFDSLGIVSDAIVRLDNEKDSYVLEKKIGSVDFTGKELKITEKDNYYSFTLSARELLGEDWLEKIEYSLDSGGNLNLELNSNLFIYNVPGEQETKDSFYISNFSFRNGELTNLEFTFKSFYFNEEERNIKSQKIEDIINGDLILTILYQQKTKYYELKNHQTGFAAEIKTKDSLTFRINNPSNYTDEILKFNVTFEIVPVLYDNLQEWAESSGLKPSQKYDDHYYDYCRKFSNTTADYGFEVYNGGDLPTPFKLTFPIAKQQVNFSNKEISIVLVKDQVESNYGTLLSVDSCVNLETTKEYYKENDTELATPYFFLKVLSYAQNKVLLINKNGEYEEFVLSNNNKLYRQITASESATLDFFTIRLQENDSLDSYAALIRDYTNPKLKNNVELFLEIDTYKQTINLLVKTLSGTKIIPAYFMLHRGNLFKIPQKVDNLYILVYNLREKGNPFIETSPNEVTIDYKYLYL